MHLENKRILFITDRICTITRAYLMGRGGRRNQIRRKQGLCEAGNEENHQQYQASLHVPAAATIPTISPDIAAALKGASDVI